eukprot:gene5005-5496_t
MSHHHHSIIEEEEKTSSDSPPIRYISDFLTPSEAEQLLQFIHDHVTWDNLMKSRKTCCFGLPYNYNQMHYESSAIPPEIAYLLDRIASVVNFLPNNCLLNYYEDGNSSMGFHSDSAEGIVEGTGVALISLGCTREMAFRLKSDRSVTKTLALPSGSFLFMPIEMQETWQHAIPRTSDCGERISLSFRRLFA